MKSKFFSAAAILAAIISSVAVNGMACGPFFPNNLLDAGDNAVLQPPVANFQRELERMKLTTVVRAVPPAGRQTHRDQTIEMEMADLAAALKQRNVFPPHVTVILNEHLQQRLKLNAYLAKRSEWEQIKQWKQDEYGAPVEHQFEIPIPNQDELMEFLRTNSPPPFPWFDVMGDPEASEPVELPLRLLPDLPPLIVVTSGHKNQTGFEAWLTTNLPPSMAEVMVTPGLPVEFAEYFRGAIARAKGDDWDARESWQLVLGLPKHERHFKTVWATFMLARLQEEETNGAPAVREALKGYEQVRELARSGFADSAGLAAASIGRAARIYLKEKNYERAFELYLEQFAAGDETAVNSLRFTAAELLGDPQVTPQQLAALARNYQVRRVVTAYLISREFTLYDEGGSDREAESHHFYSPASVWLEAVETAGIQDVEFASQLALAAYQAGRMEVAQRWILRAGHDPVAHWLQAKLFMRAGKIAEAAKLLAKLSRQFPQEIPEPAKARGLAGSLTVSVNDIHQDSISVGRQVLGELGVLHLARREYTEALDALLRSGYWMDAAYVAERVLTTDELKDFVDRKWMSISATRQEPLFDDHYSYGEGRGSLRQKIRYLLARRLSRAARYVEAINYYPEEWKPRLDALVAALLIGRDVSVPPAKRADALMAAALITRTNGMELLGTELEPDWFIEAGDFQVGVTWEGRVAESQKATINVASENETDRAVAHSVVPEKRWHYRDQAWALKLEMTEMVWETSKLLPDNSDELARWLVRGGTVLAGRDPQAADKFYRALVRRCGQTIIGQQADKLRWFPELDENGNLNQIIPWIDQVELTAELTNSIYTNGAGVAFSHYPIPGYNYGIQAGDTLLRISRATGRLGPPVPLKQLMLANPGISPARLRVGQLLAIPKAASESRSTNSPP